MKNTFPPEHTTPAKEDAFDTYNNHVSNCPICVVANTCDDDCTVAIRLWERFRCAK